MEFKKKEEENRQAKLLELEELRKRKADFLQVAIIIKNLMVFSY